ncbi:hypothetical protein QBC43DRAFT_306946 [Cladorrhinum sp. PSN259]|nr:hypothetical protein QBC43DRAFT_306946 [Cladorrhinum sp. PSN259]
MMEPVLLTQPLSPCYLFSQIIHSPFAYPYPTTLLICGLTQADFLSALAQDILASNSPDSKELLSPPSLAQLSTTRHVRTLFIPTVSHLRALLSVFSIHDSKVPPPPPPFISPQPQHQTNSITTAPPLLLAYNFISSHRDTSEWSIQGISGTAAVLVEAARREGLKAVIVDSAAVDLNEKIPVLSGSSRRILGGKDAASGGGWTGRTAELNKVMRRWFRLRENLDTVTCTVHGTGVGR